MDTDDKRPIEVSDHDHFWMDAIRKRLMEEGKGYHNLRKYCASVDAQRQAEGDPDSQQLKPSSRRTTEWGDGPEGNSRQYPDS